MIQICTRRHAMITYPPNLKSLSLPVMEMRNALKMHKMGWFGVVRGHPRSSAMSPFDSVRVISCSSLIETMRLCVTFCIFCQSKETKTRYLRQNILGVTSFYAVNRKKGGSTFDIITLGKHARFFCVIFTLLKQEETFYTPMENISTSPK